MSDIRRGSVLVIGGGVAGMQSALEMAEAGFKVYLVENSPSLGGRMSQLDKTFPTNDCAMCNLLPRMVSVAEHPNIELMTFSEVVAVEGDPGDFQVTVTQKARSIDASKCTGCGECTLHCPVRYRSYYPEIAAPEPEPAGEDTERIDAIINYYMHRRAPLMPILQDINSSFGYLPESALYHLAHRLDVPLAHILRVATFYAMFSLKPRGKHLIYLCQGTSCFVSGADRLLDRFKEVLGIGAGEVTPDRRFSLEMVQCLGCCAIAPAAKIDDRVYGGLQVKDVEKLIAAYADS
jgi:NADH:ubiquinone oxidoreductase subunit E/NAD-dependent dihydropyrimidine dehydrogenase PreA subunit